MVSKHLESNRSWRVYSLRADLEISITITGDVMRVQITEDELQEWLMIRKQMLDLLLLRLRCQPMVIDMIDRLRPYSVRFGSASERGDQSADKR